jgi:MFS superfamily sulfate permease-like transporter
MTDAPVQPRKGFVGQFTRNAARKASLISGLAAVLALLIGAGFANMSANTAPTTRETEVIRWVVVACLAVGVVFYVIGGRMEEVRKD